MQIKRDWAVSGTDRSGGSVALLFCLGRTLIRHTQRQTLGGQAVSRLPPKSEATVPGGPACAPLLFGPDLCRTAAYLPKSPAIRPRPAHPSLLICLHAS